MNFVGTFTISAYEVSVFDASSTLEIINEYGACDSYTYDYEKDDSLILYEVRFDADDLWEARDLMDSIKSEIKNITDSVDYTKPNISGNS